LMCYRIYRDASYYPEVARHNGLTDFRNLVPGTRVSFPPLRREPAWDASDLGVRKYPRSSPPLRSST